LSGVVKGRYEFHVGGEATHDNEDVKMAAARRRKGTESVNSDRNEGLISLGSREFGNRNSRTRFVLLTMTTRLNEIDDVRFKSVPRMSIGAEKLQGDIDAMVSHQMVVVVSEND